MKHWIYLIVGTLAACLFAASNHAQAQNVKNFDFETDPTGLGIQNSPNAGGPGWTFGDATAAAEQGFIVPEHTRFAFTSDRACNTDCNKAGEFLILAQNNPVLFDLDSVYLEFDFYFTAENGEQAFLLFTQTFPQFNSVIEFSDSTDWQKVTLSLDELRNQRFWLGFYYNDNGNAGNGLAIDNFRIYSRQEGRNLALRNFLNMFEFVPATEMPVLAIAVNRGGETITSFDFTYSVNGGEPDTLAITDVDFGPGEIIQINHPNPAVLDAPGKYEFVAWVSNVNGIDPDDVPEDDTLTSTVQVVSDLVPRKMLLERFTSTACLPCPQATVITERLMAVAPDSLLPVHYHVNLNPDTPDPMSNDETNEWLNQRGQMLGGPVSLLSYNIDRTFEANYVQLETFFRILSEGTAAPVELLIDREQSVFNAGRRELRLAVGLRSVAEIDINDSQLALTAIIVEDDVRGSTAQGYSQANSADTSAAFPELRGRGNPIVGYEHFNTFRTFGTDQWGDRVIDHLETLMPEDTIWTELVIRTPSGLDMSNVRVVLAVGREDAEDPFRRNIFNSTSLYPKDLDPTSADARKNGILNRMSLYPNPNSGQFTLRFGADSQYDLTVTGVDGREVARRAGLEGDQFQIDLSELKAGVYVVQARDTRTGQTFNQKLILN